MASTSLLAHSVEALLERRSDSETRYVDLQVTIRCGSLELAVGGRWDRADWRYAGAAATGRIIELSPAQEEWGAWYLDWLRRYLTDDWTGYVRPYSGILYGGRGSGKSHALCVAALVHAISVPGALCWLVAPTEENTAELKDALDRLLVDGWARWKVDDEMYYLANGSRIAMRSAYKPGRLKAGDTDFVGLNEAQLMDRKVYTQVRPSIRQSGGIVLLAANPPDGVAGKWLQDMVEKIQRGKITRSAFFRLDPTRNPHVLDDALTSTQEEFDQDTYDREILGVYVPPGDRVIKAWSDAVNLRDVPEHFVDITEAFIRRWLGYEAIDTVVGCDFDAVPHCAGAVLRIFLDPEEPTVPLPWTIGEVLAESGEEELGESLVTLPPRTDLPGAPERAYLLDPKRALVVGDASGQTQAAGMHVAGASSWRVLGRYGLRVIGPQHPVSAKNPRWKDRYGLQNLLCRSHKGISRFYVATDCVESAVHHREYPNQKSGLPMRRSRYAHLVDAHGYPLWRLFGVDRAALYWTAQTPPPRITKGGKGTRSATLALAKKIRKWR